MAASPDLDRVVKRLSSYIDKGLADYSAVGIEKKPNYVAYSPHLMKPLKCIESYSANFVAVDCSTKPIMRGNRWGIYLLRACHVSVNPNNKENPVEWGPNPLPDRLSTALGDALSRRHELERLRFEYESETAMELLPRLDCRRDYLILDGASYFGKPEHRRFAYSLYEEAERKGLKLLTISKHSEVLVDKKGRDFIGRLAVDMPTARTPGVYPIEEMKAEPHRHHRYGDVTVVRLNPRSFRLFRCDVMSYLRKLDLIELLSPLTSISDDPRCLGYPISLYLADRFSKVKSTAKLLHYRTLLERALDQKGILKPLLVEEMVTNFRSYLYGAKYPWEWEELGNV